MKIVIAGAGDVGFHLARLLSADEQDITLIDLNEELLDYARSHLDVLTIEGDASSIRTLVEAKVQDADLLISATSSGDTNLVTAVISKRLGAAKTIARVQKTEYLRDRLKETFRKAGVDVLFSPRDLASKEIMRVIEHPEFTQVFEFENGRLSMAGTIIRRGDNIVGKTVVESAMQHRDKGFRPVVIQRKEQTIIPDANTVIDEGDHVFFVTNGQGTDGLVELLGRTAVEIVNVMIIGAGMIARTTAGSLEKDYNVKLIDNHEQKCIQMAEDLKHTLVIQGNTDNIELLEEEGLAEMDAFIALTANSEANIIASLVAKSHGVKRSLALVENSGLTNLSQRVGVDTLINRKLIAADSIFRHIRKGKVKAVTILRGVNAEIIEYEVKAGSRITKKPIKDTKFPKEAMICGVIRGEKSSIPMGDFVIEAGDNVLVICLPEVIHKVEPFFT